jgi:membrane protease YdiL (CAAX protease family)
MDPTQAPLEDPAAPREPPGPGSPAPDGAGAGPGGPPETAAAPHPPRGGLPAWLAIIAGGSLLTTLLGHPEVALFFAGAGMFVLAQATDVAIEVAAYREWAVDSLTEGAVPGRIFRLLARAVVPVLGATFYIVLGSYAWELGSDFAHRLAAVWCFAAAAISAVLVTHSIIDRIAVRMFREGAVGRTRRLTARLVVLALLLPVPMQALLPEILDAMRDSAQPLADTRALVAQLLGEVAVALAGVGWLVRRRWPETAERLGLGAVRPSHVGIILAGIVAAVAINAGMEALQRATLPELWRQDQEVTAMIATHMAVWTALVLGLSAGLGEEIVLRGALQPRLGVVLTSVVFACGHVQYSWFGMLTIALLGTMLGLVRLRTNTTVAIVVHGLYDVFAVLSATR